MSLTTGLGFTPAFAIYKGDLNITDTVADRVTMIRFESCDGGGDADTIDISVDDRDWNITSPSIGEGSTTLSVMMGYVETGLYNVGTFEIDELYYDWPPKTLRLHGNSLGFSTNAKAPIVTSYAAQTLGDIVGAVAASAGVLAAIDPTLGSILVPYLNQNSSCMHLLGELERTYNGMAKFSDGYLSFTQRGTGTNASGASIGTFTLALEDFGSGSICASNRNSYSKVRASYWDKDQHQPVWIEAPSSSAGASDVPYMLKRTYPSQAEAQAAAASTMAQLDRKAKTGSVTLAKGLPSIRGGQVFSVSGCREGIDDTYAVQRAVHVFTKDGGLITTLDLFDAGDDADVSDQTSDGSDPDLSGISGGGVGGINTGAGSGDTPVLPSGQGGIGHA